MVLVKILKRKDGASLIVGVILAMIAVQTLPILTARLAGNLLGLEDGQFVSYGLPGAGLAATYLQPILSAFLQILLLEAIAWVYVWVTGGNTTTKKK